MIAQRRLSPVLRAGLLGLLFFPFAAAALPRCTDFATDPALGLAGHPHVSEIISVGVVGGSRCELLFAISTKEGPQDGYAEGQRQRNVIRVGLPLNSADGGSGGVEGAWNGKMQHVGGGGLVGNAPGLTGATNAGYAAASTDGGHTTAENGAFGNWGVIQGTGTLNLGKIRDFFAESLDHQLLWGRKMVESYYGLGPSRNYWNGCSTGGRQGLYVAREHGDQFDGFVLGAPAHYHQARRLSDGWPGLVLKDLLQRMGKTISTGQRSAAVSAAIAACDTLDGVQDGLLADPRACTWSATNNVCGMPGAPSAPNCLDADQAAAIDRIWDGPRNAHGKRIIVPHQRNLTLSGATAPGGGAPQAIKWNHKDLDFDVASVFMDDAAIAAAGNPPGAISYEDEARLGSETVGDYSDSRSVDLSKARKSGAKLLMWHGVRDNSIRSTLTIDHYTRAAAFFGKGTPDYDALKPWFRFYLAPGVDHCGGGPGPQPQDLFGVMVGWVENGAAPDRILAANTSGGVVTRTRPLCPFPQTAIHDGFGDPDNEASYACGGNLQTKENVCHGLLTEYKKENTGAVDTMGRYNEAACNPNAKVPLP